MVNTKDILETINMIHEENLDIRTITMGISLYDCVSEDEGRLCEKIYDKITKSAENLVSVGGDIEKKYGIPIVNKRVSVTPVSLVGGACSPEGYFKIAQTLDRAAKTLGINFIGGYSALVQKGMTKGAENLISVIPEALAETDFVCSSVNVASTKAGINMDAISLMGKTVKKAAFLTNNPDFFYRCGLLANKANNTDLAIEFFQKVLEKFVNHIDLFDKVVSYKPEDPALRNYLIGFEMINNNFKQVLEEEGVKKVAVEIGKELDPKYHQAFQTEWNEEYPEGVILQELQTGYTYKERLLRPALVKVNKKEGK